MKLMCQIGDAEENIFSLVACNHGVPVRKENICVKDIATITGLASVMIHKIIAAVEDLCGDDERLRFCTDISFLSMTDIILKEMEHNIEARAKTKPSAPSIIKIAVDGQALREALRKEKEEQDRGKNDGE